MSYIDRTEYRHKLEDLARELDRLTERDDFLSSHTNLVIDMVVQLERLSREV